MRRMCLLLAVFMMGCTLPKVKSTVFVCTVCGEGYYGLEDAERCHGSLEVRVVER